jgi:hypothetical protein
MQDHDRTTNQLTRVEVEVEWRTISSPVIHDLWGNSQTLCRQLPALLIYLGFAGFVLCLATVHSWT